MQTSSRPLTSTPVSCHQTTAAPRIPPSGLLPSPLSSPLLPLPSPPSFALPRPPASSPTPFPLLFSPLHSSLLLWEGPLATQLITTAGASGLLLQPFPWTRAQHKHGCCSSPASHGPPTAQGWWADEVIATGAVGGGVRIFVWSCYHGNLLDPSSTPLSLLVQRTKLPQAPSSISHPGLAPPRTQGCQGAAIMVSPTSKGWGK